MTKEEMDLLTYKHCMGLWTFLKLGHTKNPNPNENQTDDSNPSSCHQNLGAFNTDAIVYDNSPWRPGRELDFGSHSALEEDERRLKQNLATRILSNGVEVLVKDKSTETRKPDQRQNKLMHLSTLKPSLHHISSSMPKRSLLSSAVATVVNRQHMSAMFPLHQLLQHNYIIKTCLTTYTYLTTIIQNERSAVSTFETIVSVVTTESLTNVFASDLIPDIKPTKTRYMEINTLQPSAPIHNNFQSSALPKIDKRIDSPIGGSVDGSFDLIQPSEVGHAPCSTSCSCSHSQTEHLDRFKTKYGNKDDPTAAITLKRIPLKTTKYEITKVEQLRPTNKETLNKNSQYGPYKYESTKLAPTDKIVEKYTEVVSDYSDEKDTSSVKDTELLTNEQGPTKTNKVNLKNSDKTKPIKSNKNKFVVADLLKLGTLGIKGLSQLAPVIEKMTGGLMKRLDVNKTATTTTVKPVTKITPYNVNKRVDNEIELKHSNFPIYIPVDELEGSESQIIFTNATLHQNLAWAAEHKQPKAHIVPPRMIHESPLVNGGIPISPGEVITANSDVIVGKPAIGGPLTLTASGIKLQNTVNPPHMDSFVSSSEQFMTKEKPPSSLSSLKADDSYDLRPPDLPKMKPKQPSRNLSRLPLPPPKSHIVPPFIHSNMVNNKIPMRTGPAHSSNDQLMKTEQMKTSPNVLGNHGRPVFLDYIPSLLQPNNLGKDQFTEINNYNVPNDKEIPDSNPSSSDIINSKIRHDEKYSLSDQINESIGKPFLVDIQPSRVANVLIPHGSSTALVFAGSSEPHKTGDYVDDPLPYPEPGYFGSFSIDAPQLTNVHNVDPNNNNKQYQVKQNFQKPSETYNSNLPTHKEQVSYVNDLKFKWKDNRRPIIDYDKIPPPTSNQETHFQIGPQITSYNPDIYNPSNGDFDKFHQVRENDKYHKDGKDVIDKEYENYLAVPPPPPKIHYSHENNKGRPYNQRPIVHTKPIQDMKVFLNIQHPVPKPSNSISHEKLPTKVTSEIYFAAQAPERNKQTPVYTVQLSNTPPPNKQEFHNFAAQHSTNQFNTGTTFTPSSQVMPNAISVPENTYYNVNNLQGTNEVNDKNNVYTVTLNTATNVANGLAETGQVVGSSVPVAIGTGTNNFGTINANIPVGTNFAIKVEDNSRPLENFSIQGHHNPTVFYDDNVNVPINIPIGDNRWNITSNMPQREPILEPNKYKIPNDSNEGKDRYEQKHVDIAYNGPSLNSHANFPMINTLTTDSNANYDVKPVTEDDQDVVNINQKRPAKLIPNIPTNSHGWYSSVPIKDFNLNTFNNINNIKVEVSTRKIIPLSHEYSADNIPEFGQKISTVGRPPTEFWSQNTSPDTQTLGKPFTKPNIETRLSFINTPQSTTNPNDYNYIPSNIGVLKQPVYDIPIKDNSNETKSTTDNVKPVYENSDEIYDGEEAIDSNVDGEVSQESMSVPIVSTSNIKENTHKSTTTMTMLQDEELQSKHDSTKSNNKVELINFNPGTQTEKPFIADKYNRSSTFQSNTIKPIESNQYYNMKPRPFTINTATTLDHQLHQPHWQINQLWENTTNLSSDENIDLNMGEEFSTITTIKPSTRHSTKNNLESKKNRPLRPIFSIRPNNSFTFNDSNIITSTVHIKDKKPLTVLNNEKISTLPTFTINSSNYDFNRSSTEIIDLSPPPPTLDYNFKPSSNDETIMGMSPPPPRTPVMPPIRPPMPTRSPPSPRPVLPPYRTKPPRTLPPRVSLPRPTRKPIKDHRDRDDISTYRPTYDILKNNHMRPSYNRDQPSSQLLPPPKQISSKIITPISEETPPSLFSAPSVPIIIFPTPTSSGWLTSSGIDFSSKFDFAPSSIQLPENSSDIPQQFDNYSTEKINNEDIDSSSENVYSLTTHKYEKEESSSIKIELPETTTKMTHETTKSSNEEVDSIVNESQSQEEAATIDKIKVIPLRNKDRTRKPYPVRETDKKSNASRYKPLVKPTPIIKPTRTITRSENLYPTKQTTTRKIRPIPTGRPSIHRPSLIESSESSIDDDYIKPTDVLKESVVPTILPSEPPSVEKNSSKSIIAQEVSEILPTVKPIHHAGNEVKVYDEIVPTKTEFKTTVITLTKTLSEPPRTVSSIGFVNLTHTLTVTHTKTSLISQSGGAVTQTLVLTNTQTSTIVDVVTEVHTQVQPTTIIETVTQHIPILQVEPTPVLESPTKTKIAIDDISMSSEEENLIIKSGETTENIQRIEKDEENDTFFVVMNKSQNGGHSPSINADIETSDYDHVTRNEQVNSNGVSQVLFGEILLAGTPYLETTNIAHPTIGFGKDCQPDCKASRNERCQRIDGMMKCVCRPGFARMFPDRPCKPTYTYSVKLALSSKGKEYLQFHEKLADNSSKEYNALALATHEGINRMVMQSDLRDVYHGVHITGFQPVVMKRDYNENYQGVMNEFYVQLSDNAHESRLKEVIEKYLRNNNYSLGGTDVFASGELVDKLDVSDFDECLSGQFHDCSEHAQCFNLRGTYTCSCLEGFADLSVNSLYPGRICSAEPVGCELCNYHGACYSRDDRRVLCECFQWYAGSTCHINLKVVLISLVTVGALLSIVLVVCAVVACSRKPRPPQRSIVACIQGMPGLHQGATPSKQRADRRALINERADSGDTSSVQNASLPYMPTKKASSSGVLKKCVISPPPPHDPPPPPAPALMIPRARLHPPHRDSRDNASRKQSLELSSEAKLISYLESGANANDEMMRRKHSMESSYSAHKERHSKQGALVSAGFKVSTTVRADEVAMQEENDDMSSVTKAELEAEMAHFDSLRKSYSHEALSEWTDAERRIGELTLSEARSVGGTLPASTGRAASSTRLTHQEANTMAERDLGSTFLLPHVHLYKPDITSDVSEFDSL